MAVNEWVIDLVAQKISHSRWSFSIQFDGDPTSNDCEGRPSKFPEELKALEKVRLLREAYDAYIAAYCAGRVSGESAGKGGGPGKVPSQVGIAPVAASGKPTLSLKRPSKSVSNPSA